MGEETYNPTACLHFLYILVFFFLLLLYFVSKYAMNVFTYYSRKHIAIDSPENTPPSIKHMNCILLAIFWTGIWKCFSCPLVVLPWLPLYPKSSQTFAFVPFCLWREPDMAQCRSWCRRWMRICCNVFKSLQFCGWQSAAALSICFDHIL